VYEGNPIENQTPTLQNLIGRSMTTPSPNSRLYFRHLLLMRFHASNEKFGTFLKKM
jgi:hypothetical protein